MTAVGRGAMLTGGGGRGAISGKEGIFDVRIDAEEGRDEGGGAMANAGAEGS